MKKKLFLTFQQTDADTPILSTLTSRFGLIFNLVGATVNETERFIAVELEGPESAIGEAIGFLEQAGVTVETRES